MPLPNFLCIGAQKAGTSWLYSNLMQHPPIWMPPIKELHFFDHLFVPNNRKWTLRHLRKGASDAARWHVENSNSIDFSYLKYLCEIVVSNPFTEKWYRNLFDRPAAHGKIIGDITPEYSTIPEAGIKYVRALLGSPRIIYIIRDPVSRALSQLRMNIERSGSIPTTEDEWLEHAFTWDILNRGDYMTYIPRWLANFAEEDILFLPYREISKDPASLMKTIESFLNLSHHADYDSLEKVVHASKKLTVPEPVTSAIQERLRAQSVYLERQFGSEFMGAI